MLRDTMINYPNKQKGFSLIEMIVSLGVFAVVVTTAVGALLVIIATNKQLQDEQSVMTNLAFAMDSMTRELRTGYSYFCGAVGSDTAQVDGSGTKIFQASGSGMDDHKDLDKDQTKDCSSNSSDLYRGVSFVEGGDSITGGSSANRRILYYFHNTYKTIYRRVDSEAPQSIVSSGLEIIDAQFYVTGSLSQDTLPNDNTEQPTVTIYLEAKEKTNSKVYHLQTTVTQRTIDI